jgi:hypothetical protein
MVSRALNDRRKDEYTDSDDDWEGSTTTIEGRVEWQPWVVLQLNDLLEEIKEREDFKDAADVTPSIHRWRLTKTEHLPIIQERDWNLRDRSGCLVVQLENHVFFLLW